MLYKTIIYHKLRFVLILFDFADHRMRANSSHIVGNASCQPSHQPSSHPATLRTHTHFMSAGRNIRYVRISTHRISSAAPRWSGPRILRRCVRILNALFIFVGVFDYSDWLVCVHICTQYAHNPCAYIWNAWLGACVCTCAWRVWMCVRIPRLRLDHRRRRRRRLHALPRTSTRTHRIIWIYEHYMSAYRNDDDDGWNMRAYRAELDARARFQNSPRTRTKPPTLRAFRRQRRPRRPQRARAHAFERLQRFTSTAHRASGARSVQL